MLKHGYEGVRQIESHITNTMGWSATTGDVAPWVYKHLSETFVLDAESDVLRNPEDDHSVNVFDPSVRGNTDRFVLRFRKPE